MVQYKTIGGTGEEVGAMNKFLLKLYVTGDTPRAERAITNLRQICDRELEGRYELVIIDVLENPQLAEKEKIMVTPTLIRELPPPRRRIIGDLTDTARVMIGLNLQHTAEHQGEEQ
jgi:circadian clock protein KaiB